MSQNKKMRTAFIRISAINTATKDNAALDIKAGDAVIYSINDVVGILENWNNDKHFAWFAIEHNADPDNIHYHVVIKFDDMSTSDFEQIKAHFPYGQINSCRHVKSCVQYLVHLNDPDKYQYEWSSVITNAPDKLEIYKIPGKSTTDIRLQKTLEDILSGEIREYELNRIDPHIYIKYASRIKQAFEYRQQTLISNPNREVMVIFLQGPAGIGKSTFCKAWAKKNNKSICLSSSSNDPWQDYKGQAIFVYDDCNFAHTKIEDLLKAWDPHNNTTVSARYKNRLFMGDTIFVCSNTPITEWYRYSIPELRAALLRRISNVLVFDRNANPVIPKIPNPDVPAYYTVNKIKCTGEIVTYTDDKGHERCYLEYDLERIGDPYPYDPSVYFCKESDKKRADAFIHGLDEM